MADFVDDEGRIRFKGKAQDVLWNEFKNDPNQSFTPDRRWDAKDQQEFEKLPVEHIIDSPEFMGLGNHPCPLCHGAGRVDTGERMVACSDCGGSGEVKGSMFASHRQDIIDLWKARKDSGVTTAIFQEGIGSGKTTKYCAIQFLMLAEVLSKVDPFTHYGLSKKGQGIAFVSMSRNESLAKEVTFLTLLPFLNSPWFRTYFPPQVDLQKIQETKRFPSRLRFPKRVVIFPGTGSALSAIGYNLFGGGVDEANYLEVVDDSKKAVAGKVYDAAEAMHAAIKSRMKSRFDPSRLKREKKYPGILVMFSNPRYAGDFTSRMEKRAKTDKTIFFRKRCTWEAHPPERFCGEFFVFDYYNGRIIEPEDPDYHEALEIVQKDNIPWCKRT